MSVRAQREQMKKLGIKDRKLARLFYNKIVDKDDFYFLNYVYEERQNLNFFYGGGLPLLGAMLLNFTCFKHNTFAYQLFFTGSVTVLGHFLMKKRIEYRFNSLVDPYFEKYEIK